MVLTGLAFAQANRGELRLKITDPSGLGVRASVQITSEANQYHNMLSTDDEGMLVAQRLPFGIYNIEIRQPGFANVEAAINVRSAIPTEFKFQLKVSATGEVIDVTAPDTLVNPEQAGDVSQVGADEIHRRLTALPGRSMQDLVNDQPGWLYEGNAVLHPRGSEYQTQFVVDGIPLTDNRSPGFGPELEADDVQSVSVYTAGIPAEYGRKMGGVVEVNTLRDAQAGFHGNVSLSGGSFESAGIFAQGQYAWGKNALGASASGSMSGHYLNPVVPENYTNSGTLGDFAVNYERDLSPKDRLTFMVRHEFARYQLPNEQVQQAPHPDPFDPSLPPGSQLETASNIETMGIAGYQHVFSSAMVADVHAMVRDNAINFNSNNYSTPIEVFQNNWFREGYVRGTVSVSHGRHEWKAGIETDNATLNENFNYLITDPTAFYPDTPPLTFSFQGNRPDLEQSAFIQDRMHLGKWTVSAGLRWDHYQLLLNRHGVQPRLAVSRYIPSLDMVVHFSYDRVFQTPSFENILLASSTAVESIDPKSFLRLPVEPSEGNYYEVGMTKGVAGKLRVDANYYRRYVNNYADDDQIQNTAISFPIAFRKSVIYGAETKVELPEWRRFSGFVSYSYMVGNVWYPVTGGLFLGGDAQGIPTSGHFPDSQDQRNTLRGRLRYEVTPRFWIAGGVQYDTGLPFEFQCDPSQPISQCIAQEEQVYGPQVIDRINFSRQRILPAVQINASAGAELYKSDRVKMQFQVDGQNLTNVLNVIDFGGLFSGNAIGPSRSVGLRLSTTF